MRSIDDFVDFYRSRNLVVLPLIPRTKQCVIDDWQKLTAEELLKHLKTNSNIGLRLDGLVAVDIERPELWPVLTDLSVEAMAQRTWVQRTGKGYHIIFRGETKPFKVDGYVEIRSGSSQYIVVAPSIHPETLKPYEWVTDIEKTPIVEISDDDLERLRDKLETLRRFKKFIEAMTDCWRRHHRHSLSLWISGVLYKMGLSLEDAEIVLRTIIFMAHDEEVDDRIRALGDTFEKEYSKVKGWSGLREELLGITSSAEEAEAIIKLLPIRKGLLFEAMPLAQLIKNAKEIDYIANPILPRGCLIVLAGKGGVGKSLLGLHIAYCVSNGKPIFSYYDSKQTKVLLIDNENNPTILRERVELMGLNPLENIDVVSFTGWRLDRRGALAKLKHLIQSNGYGLVVMDNWTTLVSTVEENDAVQVSNILTNLRRIAYGTGCTILLIHHQRKGLAYAVNESDELRGSSVMFNEPDIVYLLEQCKAILSGDRILKTIKNRLGEEKSIRLGFEVDEEEVLKIMFKGEEETDTQVLKAAKPILEHLKKVGMDRRKNILEVFSPSFRRATIDNALRYLVEKDFIVKKSRGVYSYVHGLEDALVEVEAKTL